MLFVTNYNHLLICIMNKIMYLCHKWTCRIYKLYFFYIRLVIKIFPFTMGSYYNLIPFTDFIQIIDYLYPFCFKILRHSFIMDQGSHGKYIANTVSRSFFSLFYSLSYTKTKSSIFSSYYFSHLYSPILPDIV